jgi:hypothetical protein
MALKKLPGFKRSPAGLEWRLLRKMPKIALIGTLLPVLCSLLAHILLRYWAVGDAASVGMVDIMVISLVILHWTSVVTISIGCVVVMLMKGPAYVDDAYELPERLPLAEDK